MFSILKEHIIFICILLTCLILRLLPLFDYQYTFDEWSGLYRTDFGSFSELIEKGVKIDAHPAFVQVLIYYLRMFFGYTTWIIKLPFLLFSFGVIIYGYGFSLKNFSKQTAIIASAIFSFSLIFVYYAPIARMYISGAFFSIGLLYHFFEIFFLKNDKKIHFFFFGLFALLSALNQHINALFAFTVCASGLFFIHKNNYKPYLLTCVVVILLYLPHLSVTLYQFGIAGIGYEQGGWLAKPEPDAWLTFLKVLLGTGRTYLLFIFLIILCFIANRKLQFSNKQFYLILLFIINYLIIYFYSIFRAAVLQYSVMLFSSVAAVLAISSFINFKNKYFFYCAFAMITSVLIFKTYYRKDYLNQSVKNIYEYQFEKTIAYKKKFGNENVYAIYFDADTLMRDVLFKRNNYSFDCQLSKDTVVKSLKYFNHFVSKLKSDFLIMASSDPQHQAIAMDYFPFLIEDIETQGLYFKVYSKKSNSNLAEDKRVLHHSTFKYPNGFIFDKPNGLDIVNSRISLDIDSTNEFPFAARARLSEVSDKEGQVILVKAKVKIKQNNLSGVKLCISFNDIKTDSSYFYTDTNSDDYVLAKDSCLSLYATAYLGTSFKHIKDKTKITAFIWNTKKERFRLIDLEIKTIDFWSKKWNFWE